MESSIKDFKIEEIELKTQGESNLNNYLIYINLNEFIIHIFMLSLKD